MILMMMKTASLMMKRKGRGWVVIMMMECQGQRNLRRPYRAGYYSALRGRLRLRMPRTVCAVL